MKITLEFNSDDDHFQEKAALRAMKATEAYLALFKIRELLFKEDKDIISIADFDYILDECGINLDDLE